jgi:predicted Zn-dependent protease
MSPGAPRAGWRIGIHLAAAVLTCAGAQTGRPPDPAYLRGSALHHAGDCQAAVAELKNSADPKARMLLASCYLALEEYKPAIAVLDAQLKASAEDVEALGLMATAYERDGRGAEGAKLLEAYLQKNPGDTAIRIRLANLYASTGQTAPAAKAFEQMAATPVDNPAAVAGMGLFALKQQKWNDAIGLLRKAEKDIPGDPAIEEGLGAAYLALDQCQNAIEPLKSAQRLSPVNYRIAKSLAGCYRKLARWNELIEALRTGIEAESADTEATTWMLEAFTAANRKPETEPYLRWALSRTAGNQNARLALANLLFEGGKLKDARTEYLAYMQGGKATAGIQHRVAKIYEGESQAGEARKHYEAASAAADPPQDKQSDRARGWRKAAALDCARAALNRIPAAESSVAVKRMRIEVEYKGQKWEEVFRLASELLPQDPKNLELVKIAAESALKLNKLQEGVDLLEQAVALSPGDKALRYELAGLYSDNESLNRMSRATDLLAEYIAKDQQDGEAYLMLGNLYRKSKDLENAKLNFRLGFERIGSPVPPRLAWAYSSYGAVLWEDGRLDEAMLYQKQATQLSPDDEVSQYNFALMCLKQGKEEDLAAAQEKLRALNSKFSAELDEQVEKFKRSRKRK